jgi:sugar lactone lactonase YvrE
MIKRTGILYIILAWVAVTAGCGQAPPPEVEESTASEPAPKATFLIENSGFSTPESILHDPADDRYLVANINGSPTAVDGNGYISWLDRAGVVEQERWIDGAADGVTLNAPKGMAIIGDTLYVADITHVRAFDRETGAPQGDIEIPGATFVNDVAAGRDGWLLVSDSGMAFGPDGVEDTGTAAVYAISPEGEIMTVAAGDQLDRPNGVLDSRAHGGVVVVTYGSNAVYTLDEDGARSDLAELPTGGLDGVVETPGGRLLVSSWEGGAVYAIDIDGSVTTVATDLEAPADIDFDADRGILLVPLFTADAVVLQPVD